MHRKVKFLLFLFSLIFLFSSCNLFNNSIIEYMEYWSGTVQVGQEEIKSPYTIIDDTYNISAENNNFEIYLYIINPNNYQLLTPSSSSSFKLLDINNNNEINCNISCNAISTDAIKISAELSDENQGKEFYLSGFLAPENKKDIQEEDLKLSCPELFYKKKFIQNTPPDKITQYKISDDLITYNNTNLHYLIFNIPDQTKNKNKNVSYKIETYDKNFNKIDEEIVKENINTNNNGKFYYYSKKQKENLEYNYTITVIGELKLTSKTFSTNPILGDSGIPEPEFYSSDATKETSQDEKEIYTINDPEKTSATLKINIQTDIEYTIILDGNSQASDSFSLSLGEHIFTITLKKDKYETTTYTKTIKIQGTIPDPIYSINNCDKDTEVYQGYTTWTLKENKNANGIQITNPSNCTTSITVDGNTYNSGNICLGKHTISIELSKQNYITKVYNQNIYIQGTIPEPSLLFTNATKDTDKPETNYSSTTYTAFVDKENNVTLGVNNSMTNPIKNTIILDGTNYNGTTPISLGIHTVKIISELENYKTATHEENFFLRGTLHDPEFSYTNGTINGFETYQNIYYTKYQFSYMQNDSLKLQINYNDQGLTKILKVNNEQKNTDYLLLKPDEYYTIETTISKTNYKTETTISYIKPVIKPITLKFITDTTTLKIECYGFDYPNNRATDKGLRGTFYLSEQKDNCIIWSYQNSSLSINWGQKNEISDSYKRNVSFTVTNTKDPVKLYFSKLRRYNSGGSSNPDFDFKINDSKEFSVSRTLDLIKKGDPTDGIYGSSAGYSWVYVTDLIESDDGWETRLYIHLTATEEE